MSDDALMFSSKLIEMKVKLDAVREYTKDKRKLIKEVVQFPEYVHNRLIIDFKSQRESGIKLLHFTNAL